MELSIGDVVSSKEISKLIVMTNSVVNHLRTPLMNTLLKNGGLERPKRYCITRWHSLYNMIDSLLKLRDFCSKYKDSDKKLKITEKNWNSLVMLKEGLHQLCITIKICQGTQLTLSDFFREYINCILTLKKINSIYSIRLMNALEKRSRILLNSPSLLSAIYLDARFQILLSDEEKEVAINHIEQLYNFYFESDSNQGDDVLHSLSEETRNVEIERTDEFSAYLKNKSQQKNFQKKTIRDIIEDFNDISLIDKKEDILHYWKKNKQAKPELYSISKVIYVVPATEASVERNFSILKFIFNDLRDSLKEKILEDILTINLNRYIFYKLK